MLTLFLVDKLESSDSIEVAGDEAVEGVEGSGHDCGGGVEVFGAAGAAG
jgi:hypothetical protein